MDSLVSGLEPGIAFVHGRLETLESVRSGVSRKYKSTNSKRRFEMKGTYLLSLRQVYNFLAGCPHGLVLDSPPGQPGSVVRMFV